MKKLFGKQEEFFGTTTLGQKGQLVVPAEARQKLKLKTGEKLLVFGGVHDMLIIFKLADFQSFTNMMSQRLAGMSRIIAKNRKK